jgi:hypothetical protein
MALLDLMVQILYLTQLHQQAAVVALVGLIQPHQTQAVQAAAAQTKPPPP